MKKEEEAQIRCLADIRTAIGCGARPMQSELVQMVKDLVCIARTLQSEHSELKTAEPCDCGACVKVRSFFGA